MARIATKKKRRAACVGNMRDRITIQNRVLTEPGFGDSDFSERFLDGVDRWSLINTATGKVFFSQVGVDVAITHEVFIRFDEAVTTESWIELRDGRRLDVVSVEDLDERREFMRLLCVDKGSKTREASSV